MAVIASILTILGACLIGFGLGVLITAKRAAGKLSFRQSLVLKDVLTFYLIGIVCELIGCALLMYGLWPLIMKLSS